MNWGYRMSGSDELKNIFSDNLMNTIASIKAPVQPLDSRELGRLSEIINKDSIVKSLITVWEDNQKVDRELKDKYAKIFLGILGVQILAVLVVIFLLGFNVINIAQWTLSLFMTGVFAQTVSIILLIVKYLFSEYRIKELDLFHLMRNEDNEKNRLT